MRDANEPLAEHKDRGLAKGRADITDQFSLSQIDHQELLAILTLRYTTCWRLSDHEISFPAIDDWRLKLEWHHGQITKISSGSSLSTRELDELLAQIEVDLKDQTIAEYGAEILFSYRRVLGSFRSQTYPLQILPAPPDAPRSRYDGEHPFVLEYPIRRCGSPSIRMLRHRKIAVEWSWVLNALLRGSIKYSSSRPRHMWAIPSGSADIPPVWSQEFYIVQGFQPFRRSLSEHPDPLHVVPANDYYGPRRAEADLPIDEFYLPDNLDGLLEAFLKLDGNTRRRFLRSAAAIYIASDLWEVSISSCFVGCVQAIETLLDPPPPIPCPTCGRDTGPGRTKLFREFVETHCQTAGEDRKVMRELYRVRSALAHGNYLFQMDEAPWAFSLGTTVATFHEVEMSRSVLNVAKVGLRSWLLSQPK